MAAGEPVYLFDVDNTLLDNDQVQKDLGDFLVGRFGAAARDEYWNILGDLWNELGYRDYLGALQRYRILHPHDVHLLELSEWLIDYPFAGRLYPGALEVLAQVQRQAPAVIVSDGDVVFQPRKIRRSGIWDAVDGRVLVYIHKEKELADIARRFPARRYVLVDDKLWILAAFKRAWGDRITTVFPRQGQYAHDPKVLAANPPAEVAIDRISDLLISGLPALPRR
jgi:FMN phosphatase YigB (HAD superfamily)